jgi:hypothetical protein
LFVSGEGIWVVLIRNRYQRAFIDFFEDQLVSKRYNLQELLEEYLLGGKEPLINGMISGRAFESAFGCLVGKS